MAVLAFRAGCPRSFLAIFVKTLLTNERYSCDAPAERGKMPVFVVIVTRGAAEVGRDIAALPDTSSYEIKEDTWLVDFKGTTRELSERIGIRGSESTARAGISFAIDNFSGKHARDVWEWLSWRGC